MKKINEIESKDISLSSFAVKEKLHPKFWPNGKLNSRVRLRLMDIADDFIEELSVNWVKPSDVILTGSIANYNWSRYSDVDIHILIDFKKVYPKKSEFVEDYFKSKKENWNANHEDLKIFGFPIEISVEDSNEKNPSSGRYSLYKNKWIVEPNDFEDAIINQNQVKSKAASFMTQIDSLEKKIKSEKDLHKCETYGDKVYKIFDKLKRLRSNGLSSDKKEMSSGNIIYKILRRAGYIDKIWELVNSSYDKVNSIDERKEINEAQRKGAKFSAGIIPFRMNKDGKTEIFLGFPGQPKKKNFKAPMWMDRWQILKGHMENGEDPLKCAIREFCEESGVSPKSISRSKLIKLGSEHMSDNRKLVCYGLDLTNEDAFKKTKFHSNLIDSPKYIDMNGGKPYPEIAKYAWKTIDEVGASAPYEQEFYKKCDDICQQRHSHPKADKTIIISDEQRKEVNEALRGNFNTQELSQIIQKTLNSFNDKSYQNKNTDFTSWNEPYEYCVQHFGEPIGKGSSRVVFQIDDTRVLKLAFNKMGAKQNEYEVKMYNDTDDKGMMPTVYKDSDMANYYFIVQEYALPMQDDNHNVDEIFQKQFNITFDDICEFIHTIFFAYDAFDESEAWTDLYDDKNGNIKNEDILNSILQSLITLKHRGQNIMDYTTEDNWGIVNRGGFALPTIIDMGFDNSLMQNYFHR